jgi:thiamine biosynthesis lipoprotein
MNSEGRIALFFLFLIRGLAAGLHPYEAVEPHMGTLVRIKLYAAGEAEAQHAFRAAFDRIAQLDQVFSDYQPESELNRLCRAAAGRPVTVSRDLLRVLAASQQLAEESGGAFDITLGPVIRLWRQARREGKAPQEAALREAAARSGYRKLHLDLATGTAMLDQPGMQLDLGGIAKGDAADAALEVLAHLGIRRALVAVSGDLAFGDPPPDQAGWKIGIDPLDHADREWTRVLELRNAAVSTSGSEEQHLDADGKRYSHIIDPSTNLGLTRPIKVTVIAPRGIEADSLATAVSVLGSQRGIALVNSRPGVAALVVEGNTVIESRNWPRHGAPARPAHLR